MAKKTPGAVIATDAPPETHITRDQAVEIDSIAEHPENYNKHPEEQLQQLAASLETFGQIRAIVIKGGRIYAGNGTWKAAKRLGWKTIRADILSPEYPEHLARGYLVADNETSKGARVDEAQLLALLEEAREKADASLAALGHSPATLEELRQRLAEKEPQIDVPDVAPRWAEAQNLQRKWNTQPGQVWTLGRHRLGIGDAFDLPFVQTVQGGTPADQLLTDPPYGVDYGAKSRGLLRIRKGPAWQEIEGDQQDEITDYRAWFARFLSTPALAAYNTVYTFMAGQTLHLLRGAFDDAGLTWGDYLIWVKHCPVLTRKDYHAQHEFIVFGWKERHKRRVTPGTSTIMDHGLTDEEIDALSRDEARDLIRAMLAGANILRYDRPMAHTRHPTEKPLDLITELVTHGSPANGTVIDPFAGSGTTILAAERAHRTAHAIEKRPEYAAVTLERWQDATGSAPALALEAEPAEPAKPAGRPRKRREPAEA